MIAGFASRLLEMPARALGRALVRDDGPEASDAIVVLGGDARHRCPHAVTLLEAGEAPLIAAVGGRLADGVPGEVRRTLTRLRLSGVPDHALLAVLDEAPSTVAEAAAVARLFRDRGWERVLVVTSPYHTRRAGRIFEAALAPQGVVVRMCPSPHDPYDPAGWWRDARQRRQVAFELIKGSGWLLGLAR